MIRSRPAHSNHAVAVGGARLLAAAGLVGLLGGLGGIVLTSGDEAGSAPPTRAVAAKPAKAKSKPKPAKPVAVRIAVIGAGAYDPDGDGSENDGDARLATDGNAATAWKSERYRSSFTKSGVGLVVDAGRSVKAKRLNVVTETPGYKAEVRVGASVRGPFVAVSGAKATRARTAFVLRPRSGRFLMLWITSMPTAGAAAVNEITVTAAG